MLGRLSVTELHPSLPCNFYPEQQISHLNIILCFYFFGLYQELFGDKGQFASR